MTRRLAVVFASALVVPACGDNSPPAPTRDAPAAPAGNDAAFQISGLRNWYLIGDGVTVGDDQLSIAIAAPDGTGYIDAWIGTLPPVRIAAHDGQFAAQVSIAELSSGDYSVVLAADSSDTAFAAVPFHHSAAYYVMMSTDWDFSDPGDGSLAAIDQMHTDHPGLKMTDFVGPYTFTDPAVTPARQATIATRLQGWRDTYGDELGLHIHPYCNFVTHAGLTCIVDQSTVYESDPSGYTIKVGAYGHDEFGTLLDDAAALFAANGLGHPITFRAGGWTATADTLAALVDHGYIADASALNWARIARDWENVDTGELYRWNEENWHPVGDATQPWFPNVEFPDSASSPTLPILEVPVNGVMVDYVSTADMTTISGEIWDGTALPSPRVLAVGFHPSGTYPNTEGPMRVDGILDYTDLHLATADLGPIVYTTLTAMVPAFPSK